MHSQDDFQLKKAVWTTDDFEEMCWHDAPIHGIGFTGENELSLDIDYICHGEENGPQDPFTLWVATATISFQEVEGLQLNYDLSRYDRTQGMEIDGIIKPTFFKKEWQIYLHNEGEIKFRSPGFTQVFRTKPNMQTSGVFTLAERGGISFSKTPYE